MSIAGIIEKGKQTAMEITQGDVFLVLVIILVGVGSFALGRLSVSEKTHEPVRIEYPEASAAEASGEVLGASADFDSLNAPRSTLSTVAEGSYVASKNGSKYHLPWCAGAQAIKEENRVWFASKEEAEKAGYEPAGNCKGI